MRWLLWKDFRQNLPIVYAGLVFLVVPHLVAVYAACAAAPDQAADAPRVTFRVAVARDWQEYFTMSGVFSLVVSQLFIAAAGGNAMAAERADRSAEFLFSLPIARGKLLASKLVVAIAIAVAPWLLNLLILSCVGGGLRIAFDRPTLLDLVVVGVTFFCVAWCLSSFLASPAYAALGGLLVPLLVVLGVGQFGRLFGLEHADAWQLWGRGTCKAISFALFPVGTWHYLLRAEP